MGFGTNVNYMAYFSFEDESRFLQLLEPKERLTESSLHVFDLTSKDAEAIES